MGISLQARLKAFPGTGPPSSISRKTLLIRYQKQKIVGESTKARRTLGSEVYTFSRVKVAILAKVLALTVAFMILMIPILLLYLAEMSDGARAGLILVFVPAFAILMSLFLKARVEAVFIGTCT